MNVDYVNSFLEASQTVLKSMTNMDISLGKVYLKTSPYPSDTLVIIIGVMGDIKGQVIISMSKTVAFKVASAMMMGMPVAELDEITKSAIAEVANMILGNAATILFSKGIRIDITPPSLLMGDNLEVSTPKMKIVCVPLSVHGVGTIELDIAVIE